MKPTSWKPNTRVNIQVYYLTWDTKNFQRNCKISHAVLYRIGPRRDDSLTVRLWMRPTPCLWRRDVERFQSSVSMLYACRCYFLSLIKRRCQLFEKNVETPPSMKMPVINLSIAEETERIVKKIISDDILQ